MATRRLLKRRRQILDLGNFRKYPDTSLIELSPLLGEAHFSRGPVEQANAQLLLEGLDVARHGCLRQLQLACRTTKALSVYDLDEGRHAGEAIHGCLLTPRGCVKMCFASNPRCDRWPWRKCDQRRATSWLRWVIASIHPKAMPVFLIADEKRDSGTPSPSSSTERRWHGRPKPCRGLRH